jgi:hypothetical protein
MLPINQGSNRRIFVGINDGAFCTSEFYMVSTRELGSCIVGSSNSSLGPEYMS